MPEETRVFDVTKPKHVSPSATSKPVIVGHQPQVSDPMVKEEAARSGAEITSPPEPTKIQIKDASPSLEHVKPEASKDELEESEPKTDIGLMRGGSFSNGVKPIEHQPDEQPKTEDTGPGGVGSMPDESPQDRPAPEPAPKLDLSGAAEAFAAYKAEDHRLPEDDRPAEELPSPPAIPKPADGTALSDQAAPKDIPPVPEPAPAPAAHIEGLHFAHAKPKRRWPAILLALLVLLIAAYLLIDSGAVNAGIKLPFHVFKQKQPAPAATATPAPRPNVPASDTTSLPTGFKSYRLAGTNLTFAAPVAWGDPTSNPESGYTKRGANNQPDGTYAYTVNFSKNSDVQVAVTSAKYLPPARATQYYDYLQWCVGTNDGKYYESVLHFTTDNKVDTPSTVTCDQGPVPNVVKLDAATIVEQKATDSQGKVAGDIYTKNLKDLSLPVLRIKDASMTNGAQIKQLLNSVQ